MLFFIFSTSLFTSEGSALSVYSKVLKYKNFFALSLIF